MVFGCLKETEGRVDGASHTIRFPQGGSRRSATENPPCPQLSISRGQSASRMCPGDISFPVAPSANDAKPLGHNIQTQSEQTIGQNSCNQRRKKANAQNRRHPPTRHVRIPVVPANRKANQASITTKATCQPDRNCSPHPRGSGWNDSMHGHRSAYNSANRRKQRGKLEKVHGAVWPNSINLCPGIVRFGH